jgi:hypothetical protein
MHTEHNNVTYKNVLFPLWTDSFKWKEKTYHYAINAQSGKVVGERPYSSTKIVFAILGVLAVIAGFLYMENEGVFESLSYSKSTFTYSY